MANWLEHLDNRNEAGHVIGTSQDDRVIDALRPTHFGIVEADELSFVRFLKHYSEHIAFYDSSNHLMGSWKDMLDKSPLLSMLSYNARNIHLFAEIFHTQVEQIKSKAEASAADPSTLIATSEPFWSVLVLLLDIASLSRATRKAESLQRELGLIIRQNLAPVWADFREFTEQLPGDAVANLDRFFQELPEEWNLNADTTSSAPEIDLQKVPALHVLTEIFTELLQIVQLIRASVDHHIHTDMSGGSVKPHIATFMGFFEMMQVVYQELNQFTKRHLDYYYQDLLQIKPRPATPDHCHVVFTLAENFDTYALEAGTALLGGLDSLGNPRIYRLDRNISLNKAKLAALKVVVHDKTAPITALLPDAPLITDTYVINSEPIHDIETRIAAAKVESFFAPGLAIATALWHVEPTHALLKMVVTCDLRSFREFDHKVEQEFNARNRLKLSNPASTADKNTLICDLFTVSYSIDAAQWYTLPTSQVELSMINSDDGVKRPLLEFKVLLQPGDPAIMPCMDPAFPEAMAKGVPVFRFLVADDKLHRYQWFAEVTIHTIELEANVLDVRNLVLQNDYGLLDPNVPFQPFGPVPSLGSNFYIGHPRLFDYPLDALKINIEWFNLPTEKDGFAQHYADYDFDGDNHSFMAILSILDRKNWWPKQQKQLIKLFQSVSTDQKRVVPDPRGRISKIRRINEIDLDSIHIPQGSPNQPFLAYDKETLRGFLRLQLAEPVMAFGHQRYPEILTRQITEAVRKKKPLPTPNAPYTPTIKSISIDYTSSVKFSVNANGTAHQELLYHIHPFGVVQMNEMIGKEPMPLLPHYVQGGHLYIGIEGLQPRQPISFFFQISDEGALDYEQPLEIQWNYLSSGQWRPLIPKEQLFDTTLGLTKSGVIGFRIEERIDTDYRLLPNEMTWLSCVSNLGTAFLTQLLDIRIQASICTFQDQGNTLEHLETGLPANTVNALLVPDGAIATIEQPYASTGGRPAETLQGYYRRVSELLRHKDRAITNWDFDHLVLEHFPEIRKVICLSHTDRYGRMVPGHLLVTVIPQMQPADRLRSRVTRIGDGRIKEIAKFLKERSSPFASITVTNPVVEKVKVSAGIRLKAGYDDYNYYLGKLNQGLREMLSPWYFHDDVSAGVAVKIYASRVIEYIDHQPYVDFVANFKLLHLINGYIVNANSEDEEYVVIKPLQPHAVLVSVDQHALYIITDETPLEPGIGGMTTQVDLTVPLPELAEDGIEIDSVQKDLTIPGDSYVAPRGFTIKFKKSTP